MDEHLALLELAGTVRRQLVVGDTKAAERVLRVLTSRLCHHVRLEERGIFAALKAQGDFLQAVVDLESEHRHFDAVLDGLDSDAADFEWRVLQVLDEISLHIDKENLGIFPVAVVTLGASGWETVSQAHRRAPAGRPGVLEGAGS
jgi:hemerythrin-like domain-containing protein